MPEWTEGQRNVPGCILINRPTMQLPASGMMADVTVVVKTVVLFANVHQKPRHSPLQVTLSLYRIASDK